MIHVLVSGDVQGVGFRQYIRYKARKLAVRGWIKNLSDGSVEAVFTGNRRSVEKMIEFSKKGPILADVKSIDINEVDDQEFDSFEILK
jgi:acylphosphatase